MRVPASPHFAPVALTQSFNAQRSDLPDGLRTPQGFIECFGRQVLRGMPFTFGGVNEPNVIVLDRDAAKVELGGARAAFVILVHVAEDELEFAQEPSTRLDVTRRAFGRVISEYELAFEDGSRALVPIRRGIEIQGASPHWATGPALCVPANGYGAALTVEESLDLGTLPEYSVNDGVAPMRLRAPHSGLWIHALRNPKPDTALRSIDLRPRDGRSAVYAVTLTELEEHPLRPGVREKLRLRLPDDVRLNEIAEVDGADIGIDLGAVISARAALEYDDERWASPSPIVHARRSEREVIVEYVAHPQARLYVGGQMHVLASGRTAHVEILPPARRPVRLRFVDRASRSAVAVRLHLHGGSGEHLAPRGHHRKVDRAFYQDRHAEFAANDVQHVYVDGECTADLPVGKVFLDIARGFEVAPIRAAAQIGPGTDELVFELERLVGWRDRGWVTADTHVHFLSPQTALLEARAEGVNVVNLLAAQWGELFTNVGDFDGRTTFGEDERGVGEHLVRVGSENRMPVLGHISLLGYGGQLIQPLSSGHPPEAALGDSVDETLVTWARRCIDQGGLVVIPHAQNVGLGHAAAVVLGVVDAIEVMHSNPLVSAPYARRGGPHYDLPPLHPYALAHWYRYLGLGYHIPLVGGSDKMSADMLLGGIRTYAHLGDGELTFEDWARAIRAGNTFVSAGPLTALTVEGMPPGGVVRLPRGGGHVQIEWLAQSRVVPIEGVEVVCGGVVTESIDVGGKFDARGHCSVALTHSTWIALRLRGSLHGRAGQVMAHTSAVQIIVGGVGIFSEHDAGAALDEIGAAMAYVDTLAPRADDRRLRELLVDFESAHEQLSRR
jgi:hypothetical protein